VVDLPDGHAVLVLTKTRFEHGLLLGVRIGSEEYRSGGDVVLLLIAAVWVMLLA
jgi:hypothetical protein